MALALQEHHRYAFVRRRLDRDDSLSTIGK